MGASILLACDFCGLAQLHPDQKASPERIELQFTALFASPTVRLHTMVVFMGNLRISTMATMLLLGGCAHQPMTDTIAVSGGQNLSFTRVGAGFVKAENERLVVDEAGLTTYRTEGKNFVRWQFVILPKEETALRLVRIEDVTDDKPVLILEDRAPQIDERRWSRQSDLVHADTRAIPWLFESGRTIRVFRITVRERNGKTSTLYQAVLFTPKAKKDFRVLMGPETFENAVNADSLHRSQISKDL
jgi:hypothetical protein